MLPVDVNGKSIVLILSMILFVTACGSDVDYLGDSYPPTSHVDVYFSEADIIEDYVVMGHATAEGDEAEALKEKLTEKARERGADGIVFEEFDRVKTGEVTVDNNASTEQILSSIKRIRNAAHETDPILTKTVLIRWLAVYSNWAYSNPHQLLLDYLH